MSNRNLSPYQLTTVRLGSISYRYAIIQVVVFLATLILCIPGVLAFEELRVLVGKGVPQMEVSGKHLRVIDASGREYRTGANTVVTASHGSGFYLRGLKEPLVGPLRIASNDNLVRWDAHWFRGALELRPYRGNLIDVINLVDLEDYLCGLVNSEINSAWPEEAVKAQVVAARTYALWRKLNSGNVYHLVAATQDQAYQGAHAEDSAAVRAVQATLGWIITFKGAPILAYYHSCCGGHTDSASDINGKELPYLQSVSCPYCKGAPSYHWKYNISARRLGRLLSHAGHQVRGVDQLLPLRRTPSGRIQELEVIAGDKTIFLRGEDFRSAVGYGKVKSTRFTITNSDGIFHFKGTGYGHGLGACQWGMKGMADKGFSWREILSHYYQGVEFVQKQ